MCSPSDNPPKLSPGWNKVALLTFVRNSPCSCPFSVSLHPPQAALNSEPLRGAIVSMGLRGVQGGCRGPKGRNRNLPWPPCKKVIKKLPSLLFISTPQSIAKPSPGWNKVALLTAVRNSPCSCPFSVSLHPPLAALNSEPRPGSLLVRFTTQT